MQMFRRSFFRVLTGSVPSVQKEAREPKTFSLTGAIENTGLIEVPMGTSLRHIIYDIGGGLKERSSFQGRTDRWTFRWMSD